MNYELLRKLNIHGMLLQGAFWFGIATYFAFMVTTLIDHGWTYSEATGAITLMSVIGMIIQPVYGYICDNYLTEKKLTIMLLILAVVCFSLLPLALSSGSRALVLAVMAGVIISGSQVANLLDAWVVGLKQEIPEINYGLLRGTGSFTYALSAQITGFVTTAFGHGARFWIGAGFLLLALIIAIFYRSAKRSYDIKGGADKPIERITGIKAIKMVFSSKQYNLLLAVAFLLHFSTFSMTTLIQVMIDDFGGTATQVGTATALMAVSEVPLMLFTAYLLKKIGFRRIIILCAGLFVVRMFITASINTVDGLILIQLMQGITYAVLVPVSMSYLSRILDERIRSTAVMIFTAVTASLTGILANLITTLLLAAGFEAQTALIVFGCLAVIAFLLTIYGALRKIW